MSDQQPVYAPPPAYAPPQPPGPPLPPQTPPAKKKTGLIIAIVVGVLLLCCCIGALGVFAYLTPTESVTSGGEPTEEDETQPLPNSGDARLEEWIDWDPDSPPMLEGAPSFLEDHVDDAMGIIAPDFDVEDAVWIAGEYDEAEDWYYADAVFVRATHPASSKVSAAVEMWIQSDLMVEEDVSFDTSGDDVLTTIGDGRELLYVPQWGEGFQLSGDEEVALWEQLGQDWPDAVVTDGTWEDNTFVAGITKWEVYAVEEAYPIVVVTYELEGDDWVLVDWEYQYPDDEGTAST